MRELDPRSLAVYVVTSSGLVQGRGHPEVARAAIAGGASALQLRAPELDDDGLAELAVAIGRACRDAGVVFVVNDRVRVAAGVGAGAHVGQGDDPATARAALGDAAVLGVSVSTPEEAEAAELAGADYLGVTVWSTPTKPEARPLGTNGLREIAGSTRLPVVGIGGIDAANAARVLEAGAAGVAVISAVGAAEDPTRATRQLVEVVRSWRGLGGLKERARPRER